MSLTVMGKNPTVPRYKGNSPGPLGKVLLFAKVVKCLVNVFCFVLFCLSHAVSVRNVFLSYFSYLAAFEKQTNQPHTKKPFGRHPFCNIVLIFLADHEFNSLFLPSGTTTSQK